MGTVTTLPRGRPLTRVDLDAMPDDGHRYELIDGAMLVTPAPSPLHQRAVLELAFRLRVACPPEFEVLIAPLDVALSSDTVLQPDVLVARRRDLTERDLPKAPVLAVEVLSPSTRRIDLTLKRSRFEAASCPAYWVVEPQVPSLAAWHLVGEAYAEVAHVIADETYHADQPFAVTVRPGDLVR